MSKLIRRKEVAFRLSVTRQTLARIERTDASFPVFFQIASGVAVVELDELNAWIEQKRIAARIAKLELTGINHEEQRDAGLPRAAQLD